MMALSTIALKELLERSPSGYKSPDDEFFIAVNQNLLSPYKKLGVISNEEELIEPSGSVAPPVVIDCNILGCLETFDNVHDFQSHYNTAHRFICATCKRVLPTAYLLDMHICETHDSFFQARVDLGDAMYACYLEECKQMMLTPAERKEHCVKVHKFPANYRFDQVGIKKAASNKMDVDPPESADAAKKVKAFTFGRNKERSFNKQTSKRPAGATLENLQQLKDALNE